MRTFVLLVALGWSAVANAQAPLSQVPRSGPYVPPEMVSRWHRARVLYGVGVGTGLVGTALTLSSIVVVSVTGYPGCNPFDLAHATNPNDPCNTSVRLYRPPSPTDAAPMLAYFGASLSALGFILTASGLGWQHSLLSEIGVDTGRGLFSGGTVLGVVGFVGVGASYFFGLTNYFHPHDQEIAILASSLTGAALYAIGGILYSIDGSRMKRRWLRLTSF